MLAFDDEMPLKTHFGIHPRRTTRHYVERCQARKSCRPGKIDCSWMMCPARSVFANPSAIYIHNAILARETVQVQASVRLVNTVEMDVTELPHAYRATRGSIQCRTTPGGAPRATQGNTQIKAPARAQRVKLASFQRMRAQLRAPCATREGIQRRTAPARALRARRGITQIKTPAHAQSVKPASFQRIRAQLRAPRATWAHFQS